MRPFAYTILVLLHSATIVFGQAKVRKLPATINHPAINVSAPYISLDGNSLIYVSDNSDESTLTMFHTTKKDAVNWKEPVMMPRAVNSRLNFLKGSALSADGQQLHISSLKSGGLGGFDILVSELRGTVWSEPINLGLPINSSSHEACPSITADGSTIYFMRCDKMDQKNAEGCKLFVSKKSRLGRWDEPIELPSFINTGNSQTPRIMGDGETLIFASSVLPQNKGGMDLYLTRLKGSEWSKPVPLSFCNTALDDQYVSASSLGRYLLKDQPGQRTNEIVELLFPAELKPKASMKIDGTIVGLDDPSSPYVAVFNTRTQSRIYNGRPDKKGKFSLYVSEGNTYDLSVEPAKENFTFYSETFDLTGDRIPIVETVEATIKPIIVGTEIELNGLSFDPYSSNLSTTSSQELRRVVRMVKGNVNHKFQIEVSFNGYQSDSIKSSPGLTELIIDTLHFTIEKLVPDTIKMDSMLLAINTADSLNADRNLPDSAKVESLTLEDIVIDSVETYYTTILVDSTAIKKTYHNDRTEAQANAIVQYLAAEGVPSQVLSVLHQVSEEATLENRKTQVKIRVVE